MPPRIKLHTEKGIDMFDCKKTVEDVNGFTWNLKLKIWLQFAFSMQKIKSLLRGGPL